MLPVLFSRSENSKVFMVAATRLGGLGGFDCLDGTIDGVDGLNRATSDQANGQPQTE